MKIIRIGTSTCEECGDECRRIIVEATDEEMITLSALLYKDVRVTPLAPSGDVKLEREEAKAE